METACRCFPQLHFSLSLQIARRQNKQVVVQSPPSCEPFPKCQLPVPRNAIYPGPPKATHGRISEAFPTRQHTTTWHSSKNQRGQQKTKNTRPTKTRPVIRNYNYKLPKFRCLDVSIKTQSVTSWSICFY